MIERRFAGIIPPKPHTAFRDADGKLFYEEMFTRGGFSGAQISLRANSGSNYTTRSLHQTVDARTLQSTDAVGPSLCQPFLTLQPTGRPSGPTPLETPV